MECQYAAIVSLGPVNKIAYLSEQYLPCYLKGLFPRHSVALVKVNIHRRCDWLFSCIYKLNQPWKSKRHVSLFNAGKVECPERHLGSRLTYRLCGHYTNCFSRFCKCPINKIKHLFHHFLNTIFAESVLKECLFQINLHSRIEPSCIFRNYVLGYILNSFTSFVDN